jgi:hypothetical protein
MTALRGLFDFEAYPGVEDYAAIAADHPACRNI